MAGNRGGLLTGVATAALMGFDVPGLCSIEGEGAGEAGGGGGAAATGGAAVDDEDFFGGSAGAGEAKPGEGGEAKPGEGGEAKPGEGGEAKPGEAAAAAEWMKSFSAEKKEGELSNQEWLAKAGVKDLDALAQIARDNQKALRESGRVKIPGEGATEAEVKAYREAIGAPDKPEGYTVELPKTAEGKFEIDGAFLDPMRAIALKHNLPAGAFKELGDAFMAAQYQSQIDEAANNNTTRDNVVKEWGPQAEQGKEEFRRGLDALGLKTKDVQRIQAGFGVKETMELFRKIGQMTGEDFFAGGRGAVEQRFGMASEADAQKAIDAMIADKDTVAKLRAKDPVTVSRYNSLTNAVAAFRERASKGGR